MLISSQAFAAEAIKNNNNGTFGIIANSTNYIIGDLEDHKDARGNRTGNLINDLSADDLLTKLKVGPNLLIGSRNQLYGQANVVTGYGNKANTRKLIVEEERWNNGEPRKTPSEGYHYVYGYSNKTDGVGSYIFGRFNDVKGVHNTVSGFANTVELNDNSDYTSTMNNVVSGTHHKVKGKYNIVIGKQNEAKTADDKGVEKTIVLGYKAKAQHDNSMALGAESISTRDNEVSFGKEGTERYIANVKTAEKDTDAVNKKQMDDGDTKTLQTANQYTDLKLGTLQTQVHNFQSDFNELNGKLGKLDSKLERGLAAANALSGLVLPQVVGKASLSAAVGGYGSRNAVAIGVGYTPKANITLKSGIAVNAGKNSKISYQMGAGWVW
ncbi:YadA-like family protein [Haemophilus influenzae]